METEMHSVNGIVYFIIGVTENGLVYFLLLWIVSICSVTCSCGRQIPHGKVQCFTDFPVCSYSCDEGYKKHDKVSLIFCSTLGLIVPVEDLCTRKQTCPYDIPHGVLSVTCTREPGHTCSFNCQMGYIPSISPSKITCQNNLEWSNHRSTLCKGEDQLCPDTFYGGYIVGHCNRTPQERCTYDCYPGYLHSRSITWLTCKENRQWDVYTNSLCIESGKSTSTSSFIVSTTTSQGNVGTIVGISAAVSIPVITLVVIIGIIARKCYVLKLQRRVPCNARSRCLELSEYHEQHVTNIRQQPNTNGLGSVSSFEPPTYNDPYVYSFSQQILTISRSCKYPGPPPSYSEAQITLNESPPTYTEVVTDPSRFSLYI